MTVAEVANALSLTPIVTPEDDREAQGAYVGDLLSWVMGRAQSGNVWVTIMSNLNIVAVASLADVSCIVLAEGVGLEEEVKMVAMQKGINVYTTSKSAFEIAAELSRLSI